MIVEKDLLKNIKTGRIKRYIFFPFLKFMFDKPKNIINKQETLIKFEKNHLISFDYYKKNVQYQRLDNYNRCHGILPKYDFIGRKINMREYNVNCKKIVDFLPITKKYQIKNSKTLYKVVKRLRRENPILKEYLNLYIAIYEYSTDQLFLLTNNNFFILLKKKLKEVWVKNLDIILLETFTKKNISLLDNLIAVSVYLYYEDTRILNQKIIAFNLRIQDIKISKDFFNVFKKVHLQILSYGILRQKLRTKLTLIALASFLNTKKIIKKKIKWRQLFN